MKTFVAALCIVLIIGAYVLGYWPERQARTAAETDLKTAQAQLAEAQAQVRLCGLQNQLLTLIDKAAEKNFGDAQKQSTDFFNEVRVESGRTPRAEVKKALESVLEMRDAVTAALTKGEPVSVDLLRQALARIHEVAGPWGPASAAPAKRAE